MTGSYDTTVIGGGIIGSFVFNQLRKARPQSKIALIERVQLGNGCSSVSCGAATPFYRTPSLKVPSEFSRNFYTGLVTRSPEWPIANLKIRAVVSSNSVSQLRRSLAIEPAVSGYSSQHWLHIPDGNVFLDCGFGHRGNLRELCKALVSDTGPGVVMEGVGVRNIERAGGRWRLDLDTSDCVVSKYIVNCTGPWLAADSLDSKVCLRTKKIVAFEVNISSTPSDELVYLFDENSFLVPIPEENKWLLSITSEAWDCSPTKANFTPDIVDLQTALRILQKFAPTLVCKLGRARVHVDGYTEDRVPLVRALSGDRTHWAVGGMSGSGFRYAPFVANQLVECIFGGRVEYQIQK